MQPSDKTIPFAQLVLPWCIVSHFSKHITLIWQFTKRDVLSRYRGSYLGILWSLLRPLALLTMYTIVFGFIFESKLGNQPNETKLDFALALFCGLILFEFFAECTARAPVLMLSNVNYVTKVVFPLEILPVMTVGAALTQLVISFIPLFIGQQLFHGLIPATALYLPVVLLPLIFLCLGIAWLVASLGVFIRDINSILPVLLQIVMYTSAIFYSINKVPACFLPLVRGNPLATAIDQTRAVILLGTPPVWSQYCWLLVVGIGVMIFGYGFFMRTKSAFADVM